LKPTPYAYGLAPTSQFYFCGVPFRLDVSSNCSLGCKYCFAVSRGGSRSEAPHTLSYESLARRFDRLDTLGWPEGDVRSEMLHHRVPLHFGGLSDPFESEHAASTTIDVLRLLAQRDYPVLISTKQARQLLDSRVVNALESLRNVVVQVSLCSPSDGMARLIEPGVPPTSERLDEVRQLSALGIRSTVRLQPLIPLWLREVSEDLMPRIGETGCGHTIVEVLKVPVETRGSRFRAFESAVNWPVRDVYRSWGATLVGREWLIPASRRWDLLAPVRETVRSCGMTYGAGDYGLTHLGDTECCCGVDRFGPAFEGWMRGNFTSIVRGSLPGPLTIDHVEPNWVPTKSISRFLNSKGRKQGENTIRTLLRAKWNRPGTANAPDSLLGVTYEGDTDDDGNALYEYRRVRK